MWAPPSSCRLAAASVYLKFHLSRAHDFTRPAPAQDSRPGAYSKGRSYYVLRFHTLRSMPPRLARRPPKTLRIVPQDQPLDTF